MASLKQKIWRKVWLAIQNRPVILNVYYHLHTGIMRGAAFFVWRKFARLNILTTEETIREIRRRRLSYARIGEGELRWMMNVTKHMPEFQEGSASLRKELLRVIKVKNDNLLFGLSVFLKDQSSLLPFAKFFWVQFIYRYGRNALKIIDRNEVYGNASWSSTVVMKNRRGAKKRFEMIRRIWDGRSLVLVEGEYSRLGVGSDLFSNAKGIKRIICPAKDAFSRYDEILRSVIKHSKEGDLILISLGPTATILTVDLSQYGLQAIDFGHINSEYLHFMNGYKDNDAFADVTKAEQVGRQLDLPKSYTKTIVDRIV